MSGLLSRFSIASILLSTLALFACSSDDGGGGGAAVPPNAVVITEANAKEIVAQATLGGAAIIDLIPVAAVTNQAPSANDIISLVTEKVQSLAQTATLNLPVGETVNIPCDTGSITGTETGTETSVSGSISFNECVLGGITLNGTITYSASINLSTQDWTLSMSGNISGSDSVITTTLSGLVLNQTGNDDTQEYSINTYTFALDYTGGGGFLVQLLAPIQGNEDGALGCNTVPPDPRSGTILVTGADSTKAKGTILGDGFVRIEYDDGSGTFVEVTEPAPGSPYPCTDFFV